MFVKPQNARDMCGKGSETTRDERGKSTLLFHGRQKDRATRHKGNARLQDPLNDSCVQPLEQTHAFLQSAFKVKLTVHRARRDVLDPSTDARLVCQLINALLLDHGAVHIGQQHTFATSLFWNNDKVDAQSLTAGPDLCKIVRHTRHGKLSDFSGGTPRCRPSTPGVAQVFNKRRIK